MTYERHFKHQLEIQSLLNSITFSAIEGRQSGIFRDIKKLRKLGIKYVRDENGNYFYQDKFGDKYKISTPAVVKYKEKK